MLKITLNGREEKLNIGCRTCISLGELLRHLSVNDAGVTLNGKKISSNHVAKTIVNGGDNLELSGLSL